jgi:LmbE family N-acetylglucosaminyl deacetylase
MTERVLCVAAHPDDESLGCGATLAKHAAAGDAVSVVVLADGVTSRNGLMSVPVAAQERHDQCRAACKVLGTEDVWLHQFPDQRLDRFDARQIAERIEHHVARFKPTIVYTHWRGDINSDHRVVSELVAVACRPQPEQTVRRVLMFEVPSSTEWGDGFCPQWFEEVDDFLQAKLDAVACYGAEIRAWPHARSLDNVRMRARVRGATIGTEAAEAFVIGRVRA